MKLAPIASAFCLSALLSMPTMANHQQIPPTNCATASGFSDFDFWLGDWDVTSNADGSAQGTNIVSKEASGCFLYESWKNLQGIPGHSMNYYNPVTGKWRQIWVGSGGYVIDFSGEFNDGSMVLTGEITYYNTGQVAPFRGTWTPNDNGTVRQFFEQQDAKSGKWTIWFDGRYTRKSIE